MHSLQAVMNKIFGTKGGESTGIGLINTNNRSIIFIKRNTIFVQTSRMEFIPYGFVSEFKFLRQWD